MALQDSERDVHRVVERHESATGEPPFRCKRIGAAARRGLLEIKRELLARLTSQAESAVRSKAKVRHLASHALLLVERDVAPYVGVIRDQTRRTRALEDEMAVRIDHVPQEERV